MSARSRRTARTLPALLRVQAETRGTECAMLQKRGGIWQSWTWRAVAEEADRLAASLGARGIGPGERVLLVGGPRPRLTIALLAIQALGAVPVLPPDEDRAIADALAGIRLAFVAGQRAAERVNELASADRAAPTLVVVDGHGLRVRDHAGLESYASLLSGQPPGLGSSLALPDPGDPAFVVAPLGAEAAAEPMIVSHADALARAEAAVVALGTTSRDRLLAIMPLGCAPALLLTQVQSLLAGCSVFYPESDATVLQDIREAGPTLLAAPPLLWRQMRRTVFLRAAASAAIWRRRLERDLALLGELGPTRPDPLRPLLRRAVRDHLGLARVRLAVCFGDALPDGLAAFCDALRIPRLGGNMLARAVSAKFAVVADAEPDLAQAETRLRGSLFVRDACAVRGDSGRLAALVGIDVDAVAAWARTAGLAVEAADELHRLAEVQELIAAEIERGNARLPTALQITDFLVVPGPFSRAAGELTPEGSLRRATVLQRRADVLASLRADQGHRVHQPVRLAASTDAPNHAISEPDLHAGAVA